MTKVTDRVVFITGAASGIGFSLARAFAASGAKLMLADVNYSGLNAAEQSLRSSGFAVAAVTCDVTNLDSVQRAAQATLDRYGEVHIVVNNAGVPMGGKTGKVPMEDWRWVLDVNVIGVAHGVEVFTPIFRRQGGRGHFLNTASLAGFFGHSAVAPYVASKFAVVGYSESLLQELAQDDIGVSVLCPGYVKTGIHSLLTNRPSQQQPRQLSDSSANRHQQFKTQVENGIEPEVVAEWAVQCVLENRFYIFTSPEIRSEFQSRFEHILTDFDAMARSPHFAV
ncbi:MAG: SDR family NAD(P)-dependent oxidoreductase [Porticoccaceae bacterium]|nr:SDR family NAD(P)-dependent oxidoreductase [Porticoccaceae bacterium]